MYYLSYVNLLLVKIRKVVSFACSYLCVQNDFVGIDFIKIIIATKKVITPLLDIVSKWNLHQILS